MSNTANAKALASSDSNFNQVTISILGAPSVGKTSIIQQFVNPHTFTDVYQQTTMHQCYYPAVIINDHLYELQVMDYPTISQFPVDSLYEWTHYRGYRLRTATAYILVYDVTSEQSFQYIHALRDQIFSSRNMHDVPVFVVGNKHDLHDERGMSRREVITIIKKQWKCSGYIECSAKHNWHIIMLFKEIMRSIDDHEHTYKQTGTRMQNVLGRNKCVIL